MPKPDSIHTLYSFLRHPRVAREKIVAFQCEQLRRLIAHAYANVPYYHRLFDRNGIKPRDIQSVGDLSIIPITSKEDLRFLPVKEIVARNVDPESLIVRNSSGSTGKPFSIRRTRLEERSLYVLRQRAKHSLGTRITDKEVGVGLVLPVHPRENRLSSQILQTLGLFRREQVDCRMSPQKIIQKLRPLRPDVLTGLPGVLSLVAQSISDEDRLAIRPRYVRVGGEVLTALMRRRIMEGFKAPVFQTYGCWEFNLVAWECKETGEYHTCDDGLVVEVLKDGRAAVTGDPGEVVGTNLHSFAMPLIRYRLGDVVTKGSETCGCGRPFSTIRAIQGRTIDYFLLPGGRILHPYEIVNPRQLRGASWIRQYQLIQEREGRIVLHIVPTDDATSTAQEIARIGEAGNEILGRSVEFQVILVPEIKPEPSGKFRVCRSLVTSAYDRIDSVQSQGTTGD